MTRRGWLRRIRLAAWLAWSTLRGRAVYGEFSDETGTTRWSGVIHEDEE